MYIVFTENVHEERQCLQVAMFLDNIMLSFAQCNITSLLYNY